jgi:uncharacterized membrane protein
MLLIALILPSAALGSPNRAASPSSAPREKTTWRGRDLAAEVRTILTLKCTECHRAALRRPKGRFGNVEDLRRVAGDRKLVVPFHPDDSKLWQLIRDNEMPPARSKTGPLTAKQKDLIRAWIEAGAATTTVRAPDAISPDTHIPLHGAAEEIALPFIEHFLGWLGRFHVVLVHFPIALLVLAAVMELWSALRGVRDTAPAVRLCVLFAAMGAAAAALLGWFHAIFGGYASTSSETFALHRWTGTSAGLLAVGVAIVSEAESRLGMRTWLFRALLWTAALLVGVAGHLGGLLVYGDGYFSW